MDTALQSPANCLTKRSHHSKVRPNKGKVAQVLDLQWELYNAALDPSTELRDKAVLACAWERLENRLNRMRMKPEPKPIDVALKPVKSKSTPVHDGMLPGPDSA